MCPIVGVLVVSLASAAAANPLFEDTSPRSQELRTQPGIRGNTPFAAPPTQPFPRGVRGAYVPPTQNAPASTEASTTGASVKEEVPRGVSDIERRRAEERAEQQFRPLLQSAVQGARTLGVAAPENADGTQLFENETRILEVRGQSERIEKGAQVLREATGSARKMVFSGLTGLQQAAGKTEEAPAAESTPEETTSVGSMTVATSVEAPVEVPAKVEAPEDAPAKQEVSTPARPAAEAAPAVAPEPVAAVVEEKSVAQPQPEAPKLTAQELMAARLAELQRQSGKAPEAEPAPASEPSIKADAPTTASGTAGN